jgi:hypothetical protein
MNPWQLEDIVFSIYICKLIIDFVLIVSKIIAVE